MGRGTELFPDLGEHCEHDGCNQLDFLPFTCDGCHKVFCSEHRTYRGHSCPNAEKLSRMVVVCDTCSVSMEKKAGEEDEAILERHRKSGSCDPSKKRKARCPVRRCREVLTFSNSNTCGACHLTTCLRHRYSFEHACKLQIRSAAGNAADCNRAKSSLLSPPPIEAY